MKMFKSFSVVGMGVAAAALMAPAHASDVGTITFNGLITNTTCSAAVTGTPGVGGTADAVVTLPTIDAMSLAAAGQAAGRTAFWIRVTDAGGTAACTAPTIGTGNPAASAYAYFQAGNNVDSAGRLLNTGVAQNVVVRMLNKDLTQVIVGAGAVGAGDASLAQNSTVEDFTAAFSPGLKHFAEYQATGVAGPGTVAATVEYVLAYK